MKKIQLLMYGIVGGVIFLSLSLFDEFILSFGRMGFITEEILYYLRGIVSYIVVVFCLCLVYKVISELLKKGN